MRVTKHDIEEALLKVINANFLLEKLQQQADKWGVDVVNLTIDGKPYKHVFEDITACHNELDDLLEGAKETILDGFDDLTLSILNRIDRFDGDQAQKYYLMETYVNIPQIVHRAKQIEPLYTKKRTPVFIKRKYREAVLCYLDGRFDACCIVCRSVVEILLKFLCEKRFGEKGHYERKSITELIDVCEKWHVLGRPELATIKRIKSTGNESVHTKTLRTEQEALDLIKDTQSLLRGVFSCGGTGI